MHRTPLLLLLPLLAHAQAPRFTISTVAGSGFHGDGGHALDADLASVEGLIADAAGNIYFSDSADHRVRKVGVDGKITTVAGNGVAGFSGDGGIATAASLNAPYGIALDAQGSLYIADFGNARVRRVSADGKISTIAGGGDRRGQAQGSEALSVRFAGPRNVAVDTAGNLYIADSADHRVYRLRPNGVIDAFAGTGVPGATGNGNAATSQLSFPTSIAIDSTGNVYIADTGNQRICRIESGTRMTVFVTATGHGVDLRSPTGIAIEPLGALYIADSAENRIYRRATDGTVRTVASLNEGLRGPVRNLTFDPLGRTYVADGTRVVRLGINEVFPVAGTTQGANVRGDVDARTAALSGPIGVAAAEDGSVLIVEEQARRVRRLTGGRLQLVAGGGKPDATNGDGKLAVDAVLTDPVAAAIDSFGAFAIADSLGNRVRVVRASGHIQTIAGDGFQGFTGDTELSTSSRLNRPRGVAYDNVGNLYIADTLNHRIRRIGTNGIITTFAGRGVRGYSGDGGPASAAHLNAPQGVAADTAGNIYVADTGNHAIRQISPLGIVTTIAGGVRGPGGDGGPGALAQLNFPSAVIASPGGGIYIADTFNNRIRRLLPDGVIETVAGDGAAGLEGDGGPATQARLRSPTGLAMANDGSIYVADLDNNRVRKLTPSPVAAPIEQTGDVVVMNAASLRSGAVAPGALVSLFGDRVGPSAPVGARFASNGSLERVLGGVEVRFDGQAAPLLYAGAGQINLQVPASVQGKAETVVQVFRDGKVTGSATVPVMPATPAFFTSGSSGVGPALAVLEDGSLNSATNPAPRGSIVTLYATGEGLTNPARADGVPAGLPLELPQLPVEVIVGASNAEVLFAGAAPGFVGVMQLNVKLPGIFTPPGVRDLVLKVGGVASPPGVSLVVR